VELDDGGGVEGMNESPTGPMIKTQAAYAYSLQFPNRTIIINPDFSVCLDENDRLEPYLAAVTAS
jgi:hypothetical protein